VSASITLSGNSQHDITHNLLGHLNTFEVSEVTEKVSAGEISITVLLNNSTKEIQSSDHYVLLKDFAHLSHLALECSEIDTAPKHRIRVQRDQRSERNKRLILLDVDSTLIQQEVIELLANKAGAGAEVAEITNAAMSGQLDFAAALHARVKLLEGLPESVLEEVRNEISLTPGARELINALKELNHDVGIVSGGFIDVISPLAKELKIDYVRANKLEVRAGKLTGGLEGPIIDRAGKAKSLVDFAKTSGVNISDTVAVGDGANDIDMLKIAGLGVAFNAKPVLRSVADISLNSTNLVAVLYLIGLSKSDLARI
jgi:phosphoserine phosphatase